MVPSLRRLGPALTGALLAALWVLAAAPAGAAPVAPAGAVACSVAERAAGETVAVLVEFPGGDRRSACVAPGGSGLDVLVRAGFAPVRSSFEDEGAAVCAITHPGRGEQIGCATGDDCLTCQAPDYWRYFPDFTYSASGAGGTRPAAGHVEIWSWGSSTRWSGSRPGHGTLCAPAPPPSTTPPTSAPPVTRPPGGGPGPTDPGTGSITPGGATPTDPGPGATTPDGDPAPTSAPAPGDTTTTASASSTTTTTAPEGGAGGGGPDDTDEASTAADERAVGAPPTGTVAVTDDGGGAGRVLVPVATTGGFVAVLAAFALRARRRRVAAEGPPGPSS